MNRRLVAAVACRNQGSRLYGKPLQALDVNRGFRVIDALLDALAAQKDVDAIVLGIAEGSENLVYQQLARERGLEFIVGDETDVLGRLIHCGEIADATDILRVTSESPFPYLSPLSQLWKTHTDKGFDASFFDDVVDGCGFEIIALEALKESHRKGNQRHRSELCTLYIRENPDRFDIQRFHAPEELVRHDLRLTVDNPEDLIVCRHVFAEFAGDLPTAPLPEIIAYLDTRPDLVQLINPFTEDGYATMYL